jgi:hypothetical protein
MRTLREAGERGVILESEEICGGSFGKLGDCGDILEGGEIEGGGC